MPSGFFVPDLVAGLEYSGSVLVVASGDAAQVAVGAVGPADEAGVTFGSAEDVNLYRSAANVLKTDDDFQSALDVKARVGSAYQIKLGYIGTPDVAGITFGSTEDVNIARPSAGRLNLQANVTVTGNVGFYNTAPVAKPTGVAVSSAGIHAALVTLGLIAA